MLHGAFRRGPQGGRRRGAEHGIYRRSQYAGGSLQRRRLFVGPSQIETFGQVFIEAAACGTPSVGYAGAGGVAEAVADGLSGTLAEKMEPADLANAIRRLYEQPSLRQDMATPGHGSKMNIPTAPPASG